ncbi:MAG: hypothetical protein H6838_01280 [Planctomycetes bacterium]|nr:hypothetical protein [Planctomycetota bacterium]MCB9884089.1 hypothetical protein [Planctomycetota bacterium]
MIIRTGAVLLSLAAAAAAQMEKREVDLYDPKAFAAAAPAVGSPAPDLQLCGLDGRPRCLQALLGSTVVIVKGSYT